MSRFCLNPWPFEENAIMSVYWISSPHHNSLDGAKTCTVYFQNEMSAEREPLETQWGLSPELWIGRKFKNGLPIDDGFSNLDSFRINISQIGSPQIIEAAAIPRALHPLFPERELYREYCVKFFIGKKPFIIPCIELIRAFYLKTSFLANQLISTGGLDDLIIRDSWQANGRNLTFDFAPIQSMHINREFAETIAALYGVPELRLGWKKIYTQYASNQKFHIEIPAIPDLKLFCHGKKAGQTVLITHIESLSLPFPFDSIKYGPERPSTAERSHKNSNSIIPTPERPDVIAIGPAESYAQRGTVLRKPGSSSGFIFQNNIEISRKKGENSNKKATRQIKGEINQGPFSSNDQVGYGDLPSVNFDMSDMAQSFDFAHDEDFSEFCKAIKYLSRVCAVTTVTFDELPDTGKSFSYMRNSIKRRKYACAEVIVNNNHWLIFELCLSDGYSLSTLFIKSDKKKEELVKQLLYKLSSSNGHWTKECFSPEITYRILDHYEGRSAQHWADLMYRKMI